MAERAQEELLEHFRIGNVSINGDLRLVRTSSWKRTMDIARGAFGMVYLESYAPTGQVRAVKEVLKHAKNTSDAEIVALVSLSKPQYQDYFVRFFGWYEDESSIFLIMEYLKHGDLRQHMQSALLETEAHTISLQLFSALDALHKHGFVHRDINPNNILVVRKGPFWHIKIADFATSKRYEPDSPPRTMIGTPQYMAPEVLDTLPDDQDPLEYDYKVDIWSAGVTTFEILCTKRPFPSTRQLVLYCSGRKSFPDENLAEFNVSEPARRLLRHLLAIASATRPSAEAALLSDWLQTELLNNNRETSGVSELESAAENSSSLSIRLSSTQIPNTHPLHLQPSSTQLDTQTLNAQQPDTQPPHISSFRTSAEIVSDANFQSQPDFSAVFRDTEPSHQSSRVETENSSITHSSYTVGWICAIPTELAAAVRMLDRKHERLGQSHRDHNSYVLGRIGRHDVAITCLPDMGNVSAAIVAEHMTATFPAIKFVLMVGIGGGVPSNTHDIHLGDVVVGYPIGPNAGVMQYRSGKMRQGKQFEYTGFMNRPPKLIMNAVNHLRADHLNGDSEIPQIVSDAVARFPKTLARWSYPGESRDVLFQPDYTHVDERDLKCEKCDKSRKFARDPRDSMDPEIFYGLIASGDLSMRDSSLRDELRDEYGVLCFEMEAAGLMNHFPCLVIRGISDYCDSHKNKSWQPYAAITAAAYARELLTYVPWEWTNRLVPASEII